MYMPGQDSSSIKGDFETAEDTTPRPTVSGLSVVRILGYFDRKVVEWEQLFAVGAGGGELSAVAGADDMTIRIRIVIVTVSPLVLE